MNTTTKHVERLADDMNDNGWEITRADENGITMYKVDEDENETIVLIAMIPMNVFLPNKNRTEQHLCFAITVNDMFDGKTDAKKSWKNFNAVEKLLDKLVARCDRSRRLGNSI